jgi:GntR family transcriptional regulator
VTESFQFQVNPSAGDPIYRQLIEQVRRMVASGQLKAGDELPSVRDTAVALAVNSMTVSKAYSLMEAEGLLERQRGKGMVVAAHFRKARSLDQRVELLEPALDAAARQSHELEIPDQVALAAFRKALEEHK